MTTKSPANAAHDAARAEDEQRARAELHEYITTLERELADARGTRDESKHRCGWATRAKVAEGERDAARQLAAEREQERASTAERLATTERARNAWIDRCASMEHERDSAKRSRDEAQRDRDDAVSNRDEWRHRAEVADHAREALNERLAAAEKQLAEVTRERDEARRIAEQERERGHEALRKGMAKAQEATRKRDETRRERDMAQAAERTFALRLRLVHEALGDPECEVVLTSDLVARRLHEAEESGMVRGLHRGQWGLWSPAHESAEVHAARICAEARTKGGE